MKGLFDFVILIALLIYEFIILAIIMAIAGTSIGLSYAFGWIGVHQTSQQDADCKVSENIQSHIEGKKTGSS